MSNYFCLCASGSFGCRAIKNDIMHSLHIHTSVPRLFQAELEKTAGSRRTCFGVRVPRTLDYPTLRPR